MEFETQFATEEACREYLFKLRWPEGFICPRCEGHRSWVATRDRIICVVCRYQASITARTIFEGTHKPLRLWFRAMWYVTSQKNGGSAIGLQRILGLGSYPTAWSCPDKSESLGFPIIGMKFDVVTQWVIAYDDKSYTPLQGLPWHWGEWC